VLKAFINKGEQSLRHVNVNATKKKEGLGRVGKEGEGSLA